MSRPGIPPPHPTQAMAARGHIFVRSSASVPSKSTTAPRCIPRQKIGARDVRCPADRPWPGSDLRTLYASVPHATPDAACGPACHIQAFEAPASLESYHQFDDSVVRGLTCGITRNRALHQVEAIQFSWFGPGKVRVDAKDPPRRCDAMGNICFRVGGRGATEQFSHGDVATDRPRSALCALEWTGGFFSFGLCEHDAGGGDRLYPRRRRRRRR